jgi:hypothetical protein
MAVFWVVAPCSLVEVYQRFRGPCCLLHQGDVTLVNFYQTTQCYNPEDSHLCTHRRKNLKSYLIKTLSEPIIFTDDTSVIIPNKKVSFCTLANSVLSHMSKWFIANKLALNLDKTKIIKFVTYNSPMCIRYWI